MPKGKTIKKTYKQVELIQQCLAWLESPKNMKGDRVEHQYEDNTKVIWAQTKLLTECERHLKDVNTLQKALTVKLIKSQKPKIPNLMEFELAVIKVYGQLVNMEGSLLTVDIIKNACHAAFADKGALPLVGSEQEEFEKGIQAIVETEVDFLFHTVPADCLKLDDNWIPASVLRPLLGVMVEYPKD